jgi:aminoglycoside phosphotransferase (APT) family kinase protein
MWRGEVGVVRLLRAWAETGVLGQLVDCYRADAELEALIPGRRVHREGVDAIGAELGSWWSGPANVVEVTTDPTPGGTVSVDIERHPLDGAVPSRLGHVLRLDHGEIVRHLVMCSRPRHVPHPGLAMPLAGVRARRTHSGSGASGSIVEMVETRHGQYVVKHCSASRDWLMRATHDTGREAVLFRDGVLADLPASIVVPIVAAEPEGDGWVIVMRDVSDHLPGAHRNLTRSEVRRLFAALVDMHRLHEGRVMPVALADLRDRINAGSSQVAAGERDGADWLPKWFQRSWELVDDLVPGDVAAIIHDIDRDPSPMASALLARGRTLLHGDVNPSNVGFTEEHIVLLDWQMASAGPGVMDLVWLLNHAYRIDATFDELLDDARAAGGSNHDEFTLQLAILANVPFACALWGTGVIEVVNPQWRAEATDALDWWVRAARTAADYTTWA